MTNVTTRQHADLRLHAAIAALNRGDMATARREIEPVVESAYVRIEAWLVLAIATRRLGDYAVSETAADKVLAIDPGNLRGMIIKGDCRATANDARAARSFYQAVIAAAHAASNPPPEIAGELERITAYCQATAAEYRDYLEDYITRAGVPRSRRFQDSLDLLFGTKQLFLQQPSVFYFPGLPQIQFYERSSFPWLADLESATDAIRDELLALLESEGGFVPYVADKKNRPHGDFHGLNGNPDWSALHIYQDGAPVAANVARAPRTFAAMQDVPLCHCAKRTPGVMFSLLRAHTRIPAHNGMLNTRLICHLPLIVPPGCGFRVGNEVREWVPGNTLIFDDSIEHEAWNDSDQDRVILLFDIWRPELSLEERAAVSAIFEAIDSYGGGPAM
ncbi:MAG: hypothetical protein B7Y45_11005 [Sphingomonas sp. 28-66-16]|nr:MAG: hypothetical protein B7Y45_11005 [Sphingomonas sp. 28-66-16]